MYEYWTRHITLNDLFKNSLYLQRISVCVCLRLFGRVYRRVCLLQVYKCIKVLNKHGGATGEQLRATLRYSTMHYNSDTTPKNIRNALAS